VFPLDGSPPRPIPGLARDEEALAWTEDGRSLYVWRPVAFPGRVDVVDVGSGQRRPWRDLAVADGAGVNRFSAVAIAPDGQAYAYAYLRYLSSLFVLEGIP
jgi:hypothetical protein